MTLHLTNADSTSPVISVVPDGAAGATTNSTGIPAVAVGSTFTVDIRIDNIGSVTPGINGLSYTLLYDPTVLQVSTYHTKQTSFWGATAAGDLTAIVVQKPAGTFTESSIIVPSGAPNENTNTPGVATTITFTVLTTGSTTLNIQPSDVGVTYLEYPDSAGVSHDIAANTVNAIYGATTSPTPTPTTTNPTPTPGGPTPTPSPTPTPTPTPVLGTITNSQAVMNLQNGTTYAEGSQIVLDGSQSTAGFDSKTCPIQNYAWLLQYQNGSVIAAYSGSGVSFTINTAVSFNVTLIVTAPDLNPNPSPSYTNTSYASTWINVQPGQPAQQQANIDVFTNNGGIGHDVSSGPFGPQQLVQVYAYVTFNGAPVVNKDVAFTVLDPKGTIEAVETGLTNSTGYASMQYRTPWLDTGTPDFGIWSIIANVDISQVVVTDTVTFDYNNLVNLNGVAVPGSVQRGCPMNITAGIQGLDNSAQSVIVTFTVCDVNSVPVVTYVTSPIIISTSINVSTTVTIPTWAFVGTATVYVNVLTNPPIGSGVPYCPEQSATFQITQ